MKILLFGLPGAGKTTLAKKLEEHYKCPHWNADIIREHANDWDFSPEGRARQLGRMITLADESLTKFSHVICDFVAPYEKGREEFNADVLIWMDTIKESRYPDTDKIFETPTKYDFRVTDFNYVVDSIIEVIDSKHKNA